MVEYGTPICKGKILPRMWLGADSSLVIVPSLRPFLAAIIWPDYWNNPNSDYRSQKVPTFLII
jgi:hypothetical protein